MYKIIIISIVFSVLGTACAVLRRGDIPKTDIDNSIDREGVINGVISNNISKSGYFVRKASIDVFSGGQKESIVATLKYSKKEEYLLSLRSKTGIEFARAYIGRDSLLINDRINKILYSGKTDYLEKKFSLPAGLLPLILGDFLIAGAIGNEDTICMNGKLDYHTQINRNKIYSVIDCRINKVIKSVVETGNRNERINLEYSDFKRSGSFLYPGKIGINGLPGEVGMSIEINNIEIPWLGDMTFIPGNRYEIVEIK